MWLGRGGVGVKFKEGVFGKLVAEVVVAHVGGEESAAVEVGDVLQIDGVAQAVREDLPDGCRRGP